MQSTFKGNHPAELFNRRIRSASELKRLLPYQTVSISNLHKQLANPAAQSSRCLYVHIPFCSKACNFCGYYKCVGESVETMASYVNKLKLQLEQLGNSAWVKSQPFNAIYFGGGTPTALPAKLFAELLESICVEIPLTSDVEITIETSIAELSDDYFAFLRLSSINRVSMGIQTFNETLRHKHSRFAGIDSIKNKVEKLVATGIENRCADLMYNLEGQTLQTWETDLNLIAELDFTGCSVYPLLPFPGAPMVRNNTYPIPEPHLEYQYFQMADSFLCNLPEWESYTPVQYGHFKLGRSNYVQQQAIDADVLALGPGAGGKINGIQYLNVYALNDFLLEDVALIHSKTKVFQLPSSFKTLEAKVQLFKAGSMSRKKFDELFLDNSKLASKLIEFHLLEVNEHKAILSQPGRFWAANLASLFIDFGLKDL